MEEAIRNVPMLKGLTPDQVRRLAAAGSRMTLSSGQRLFTEGDATGGAFIVERGRVRLTRKGTRIADLGTGQMFGEMASLDGGPRVVTVTASEPTTLIALPPDAYNAVVFENTAVLKEVLRVVLSRVRGLEDAIAEG
jgi:CRP-like cAMP-binding protein